MQYSAEHYESLTLYFLDKGDIATAAIYANLASAAATQEANAPAPVPPKPLTDTSEAVAWHNSLGAEGA